MRYVAMVMVVVVASSGVSNAETHAGFRAQADTPPSTGERRSGEAKMPKQRLEVIASAFEMPLWAFEKKYDAPLYEAMQKLPSETEVATLVAKWYGTIATNQLGDMLKTIAKEREAEDKKERKDDKWLAVLDRVIAAAPVATGDEPSKDPKLQEFNTAFKAAYEKVKEYNANFHKNLANSGTNAKAKDDVRNAVDRDLVMGFLATQAKRGDAKLAGDLAAALALDGGNGHKFVDLIGGANAEAQRLFLGKNPQEFVQSLKVASQNLGNFNNVTWYPKQHETPAKSWYVDGEKWVVGTPAGGAPQAPPKDDTSSVVQKPGGNGTGSGGSSTQPATGGLADITKEITEGSCMTCHAGNGSAGNPLNFVPGDSAATSKLRGKSLRQALEKGLRQPNMSAQPIQAKLRELLSKL